MYIIKRLILKEIKMHNADFETKLSILLSWMIWVLGKGWGCRKPGGNSKKFSWHKVLSGAVISVLLFKFWNICSNLDYKENNFYPFPSLFRKKKTEMEHFKAPANQRFFSPPVMVGSVIKQFGQSFYLWIWLLPCATQIQILYWHLKV